MSHKAFYQTFFQTEQLFRRADDMLTFPAIGGADVPGQDVAEPTQPDVVNAPAVQISDPVVPLPTNRPVVSADVPIVFIDEVPAANADVPTSVSDAATADLITNLPAPTAATNVPETIAKPDDVPAKKTAPQTPDPPQVRRPATPLISQKVLILVDEDLLPSDLLFLEKVLKAVHLDVEGVDLLNVHGTKNVNFQELLSGKLIHHFFTFGVPFSRLNLDIMMDRYQPVRFEGITFLMADTLPTIEADVQLKKKLWESLKKIFLWR